MTMEMNLKQIKSITQRFGGKFKVCKNCKCINYHLNNECFNCDSETFYFDDEAVLNELDSEYEFFEKQGLVEEEIDRIIVRIK